MSSAAEAFPGSTSEGQGSGWGVEQMAHVAHLRQLGNDAFKQSKYEEAIDQYTQAIRQVRTLKAVVGPSPAPPLPFTPAPPAVAASSEQPSLAKQSAGGGDGLRIKPSLMEEEATLLSNRSAAFASLCRQYLTRPAVRSESSALFGLEPGHLAALALADAQKAVNARPDWPKAHHRLGVALCLSERYADAQAAYLAGLSLEPTNKALQEGLAEMSKELQSEDEDPGEGGKDKGGEGATTGTATLSRVSSDKKKKRPRVISAATVDDFECVLCMKLLYNPVTTPCGHTFCQGCFSRALDHKSKCPVCRTVLHIGRDLPITITLANIICKSFPLEYSERGAEEAEARLAAGAAQAANGGSIIIPTLPLFVMSILLPGERMALNIFEPRYRLMVRRVMEGNRTLGMAQTKPGSHELEEVAVESELIECVPQPDGRYHLELIGRRRVELISTGELDGYRVAQARVFEDNPLPPSSGNGGEGEGDAATVATLTRQVATSMEHIVAKLRPWASGPASRSLRAARVRDCLDKVGPRPPLDKYEAVSFWAGGLVVSLSPNLNYEDRTRLLTMKDTLERLRFTLQHMEPLTNLINGAFGDVGAAGEGSTGCRMC